jgi:tetratricopeptide (TPR) repeat protein
MRNVFTGLALTLAASLCALGCNSLSSANGAADGAANGAGGSAVPVEDTTVYEGDGLSLLEAIEQSAEKIAADLPAGSRVAFAAWESPSLGLSDYIMEELTGALVERGMEVADRQNLEYVYKELNLHMSGAVNDASARSIGKFLGADLVITGQFTDLGGPWRYRANTINVESATRDSVTRLDVRGDPALRRMVAALANQRTAVKASGYGVSEQTTVKASGNGESEGPAQTAAKASGGASEQAGPKTAGAFLDRGIMFAMRGDYELAIADFTDAIALNNKLSAAYMLRGRAVYGSATEILSAGENFSSIIVRSTSGKITASQGQAYDKAIADYTQAIRLDPNNAVAYRERGVALSQKGDNDKAIADYNQAIRLNPNYARAYINRGNAYDDKGDYDKAIADYNQAIRLDPNDALAYVGRGSEYAIRGIVYAIKGDYDKAIADYTQAIRLDPNYADAYVGRGVVYYYAKDDYDRAIADCTAALRINPNHDQAKQILQAARDAKAGR